MTIQQALTWVTREGGTEVLHFVEKTSCCGAKVYPSLMRHLQMCPVCGDKLEGAAVPLPVRKSTRPLA